MVLLAFSVTITHAMPSAKTWAWNSEAHCGAAAASQLWAEPFSGLGFSYLGVRSVCSSLESAPVEMPLRDWESLYITP
jgi:hypothetical protein